MSKKVFQIKLQTIDYLAVRGRSLPQWAATILMLFVSVLFSGCQDKKVEKLQAAEPEISTLSELGGVYYLIRHAEKDRANPQNQDPELTQAGLERAKLWQSYFDSIPLTGIYSTAYKRTLQTVIPTAAAKSLTPQIYQPLELLDDNFFKKSSSGHWLIVGHSNTVPQLTNALMAIDTLHDIPDTVNSRLYRADFSVKPAKLSVTEVN